MLKLLSLFFLFVAAGGHKGIQTEGDIQSALMPQELNPAFVPDKFNLWQSIAPLRQKRDVDSSSILNKLKTYSRVISCVVLALSAVIEIVVYFAEAYSSRN